MLADSFSSIEADVVDQGRFGLCRFRSRIVTALHVIVTVFSLPSTLPTLPFPPPDPTFEKEIVDHSTYACCRRTNDSE
jgi:hypothetical protein